MSVCVHTYSNLYYFSVSIEIQVPEHILSTDELLSKLTLYLILMPFSFPPGDRVGTGNYKGSPGCQDHEHDDILA